MCVCVLVFCGCVICICARGSFLVMQFMWFLFCRSFSARVRVCLCVRSHARVFLRSELKLEMTVNEGLIPPGCRNPNTKYHNLIISIIIFITFIYFPAAWLNTSPLPSSPLSIPSLPPLSPSPSGRKIPQNKPEVLPPPAKG